MEKRRFEAQQMGILETGERLPDDEYEQMLKQEAQTSIQCQSMSLTKPWKTMQDLD